MDSTILKKLNKLNKERIFWLKLSAFVVLVILLAVLNITYIINSDLIFLLGGFGLIVAVIWWCWTMSIIRKLIEFKTIEANIMNDIISDVREIKQNIKEKF